MIDCQYCKWKTFTKSGMKTHCSIHHKKESTKFLKEIEEPNYDDTGSDQNIR